MKDGFLPMYDEGMARIVTSLKSDDYVCMGRQQINDLAFPLITPLGADNNYIWHDLFLTEKGLPCILLLGGAEAVLHELSTPLSRNFKLPAAPYSESLGLMKSRMCTTFGPPFSFGSRLLVFLI